MVTRGAEVHLQACGIPWWGWAKLVIHTNADGILPGFVGLGFLFFITQDDIKIFVDHSPGNIKSFPSMYLGLTLNCAEPFPKLLLNTPVDS